ncbi:SCO family protein [Paenibacillus spongiae]|uniref:SCO family protein n=1 Tax=Paenibacillus spongiae TaxID=2909671 RepID=A0ABY5SGA7_9BACL|nr:SCO family protein [Paenibacillus spongiae]UVI31713.1 SCO family protein [Paenibacillus spongiae]
MSGLHRTSIEGEKFKVAFIRKHAFKIAVLALCAALGLYLYLANNPKETVKLLDTGNAAPNFQLTDLDNKPVTLADSNGKVRVVYFYFANCPDVCPPTTFLMSQLQDKLKKDGTFGKDVEFISISFDPERDTPEVIRKFIEKIPGEIDQAAWTFLRGKDEAEIKKLMEDFGLSLFKDEKTGNFGHTDTITVIDRDGNIRKYMTGSIDETVNADQIKTVVDALIDQ